VSELNIYIQEPNIYAIGTLVIVAIAVLAAFIIKKRRFHSAYDADILDRRL